MRSGNLTLVSVAAQLERLIRAKGDYSHLHVRPRAGHLNVEAKDSQGVRVIIARATPIGAGEYGLSFRSHTGRWDPLPVSGSQEVIVQGLLDLLGPHLDRSNLM